MAVDIRRLLSTPKRAPARKEPSKTNVVLAPPTVGVGADGGTNYREIYEPIARAAARRYGFPEDVYVRQVNQESGFNPRAGSPAGAQGINQIMPGTARGWGVDPWDPVASLDAGAKAMAKYYKDYGDLGMALAAYNAGPGAVNQYGGVPPYDETRRYLAAILGSAPLGATQPMAAASPSGGIGERQLPTPDAGAPQSAAVPSPWAKLAQSQSKSEPSWGATTWRDLADKTLGLGSDNTVGVGANGESEGDRIKREFGDEFSALGSWANKQWSQARPQFLGGTAKSIWDPAEVALNVVTASNQLADRGVKEYAGAIAGAVRGKGYLDSPEKRLEEATSGEIGKLPTDIGPLKAGTPIPLAIPVEAASLAAGFAAGGLAGKALQAGERLASPAGRAAAAASKGDVEGVLSQLQDVKGMGVQATQRLGPGLAGAAEAPAGRALETASRYVPPVAGAAAGITSAFNDENVPEGERVQQAIIRSITGGALATGAVTVGRGLTAATAGKLITNYRLSSPRQLLRPGRLPEVDAVLNGTREVPALQGGKYPGGDPALILDYMRMGMSDQIAPIETAQKWWDFALNANLKAAIKAGSITKADAAKTFSDRAVPYLAAAQFRGAARKTQVDQSRVIGDLRGLLHNDDEWTALNQELKMRSLLERAENGIETPMYLGKDANGKPIVQYYGANDVPKLQEMLDNLLKTNGTMGTDTRARLDQAAKKFRQWTHAQTDENVAGGTFSAADALDAKGKWTVPMHWSDVPFETGREVGVRRTTPGVANSQIGEMRTGIGFSDTSIESTLKHFQDVAMVRERNIVFQEVEKASKTAPGALGEWWNVAPEAKAAYEASLKTSAETAAKAGLPFDAAAAETLAKKAENAVGADVKAKNGYTKVPFFQDGQEIFRQAPNWLADALGNLDSQNIRDIMSIASKPTQLLRLMSTGISLPFMVTNVFRDVPAAIVNNPMDKSLFRNQFVESMVSGLLDNALGGKLIKMTEQFPGIQKALKHAIEAEPGVTWRQKFELERGGGSTYMGNIRNKTIAELAQDPGRISFSHPIEAIEALSAAVDNWPRVAIFRAASKAGATTRDAIQAGRTSTVDFSKSGTWFRVLNGLIPYFNARSQGNLLSVDRIKKDPMGFATATYATVGLPALAAYGWNRANYSDLYDGIDQKIKDRNFVVITGSYTDEGTEKPIYLSIPKDDYAIAMTMPIEHALDEMYHTVSKGNPLAPEDRTERTTQQTLTQGISNTLPFFVAPDDLGNPVEWVQAAVKANPFVGTMQQVAANYDYQMQQSIVPNYDRFLAPADQTTRGSNTITKNLAKWWGDVHHTDTSPATMDFILRHMGGSVSVWLSNIPDGIYKAFGGEAAPIRPPDPNDPMDIERWKRDKAQQDTRPDITKWIPILKAGISAQTIAAKAQNLSPEDQEILKQTNELRQEYQHADSTVFKPAEREIFEKYQRGESTGEEFLSNYFDNVSKARSSTIKALGAIHKGAITDPKQRAEFNARMPGVPLAAITSSIDLPQGTDIEQLYQQYRGAGGKIAPTDDSMGAQAQRDQVLYQISTQLGVSSSTLKTQFNAFKDGKTLPVMGLPGLWLDMIAADYERPEGVNPALDDSKKVRAARQEVIQKAATEAGMDPAYVKQLVQFHLASDNGGPAQQMVSRAMNLLDKVHDETQFPRYADPSGRPMGGPSDWDKFDDLLGHFKGQPDAKVPPIVRAYRAGEKYGHAQQVMAEINDPSYSEYQRFFGPGRKLNALQWEEYQTGHTRRYTVGSSPNDWNRYDAVIRLAAALPATSPLKRVLEPQAARFRKAQVKNWEAQVDDALKREGIDLDA